MRRSSTRHRERVEMPTYAITTEDVEYLRHGDRRLVARLYRPTGAGPFAAVVDLHGGFRPGT